MRARDLVRVLNPTGWAVVAVVAALAVGGVAWMVTAPGRSARQAAVASAGRTVAQGDAANAREASKTVAETATAMAAVDDITRKTDAEIAAAPGADKPVEPAVAGAGRRALCLRNAYAHDPRCQSLQQPGPK